MAAAVAAFTVTVLALVVGALAWAHPDNQLGPLDTQSPAEAAGSQAAEEKVLERPNCPVSSDLVPACGRWWGVAPAALTGQPRQASLLEFEEKIGRPVDIYHGYHRDDEVFPTKEEVALAREPGRERLLFLNWKPSTTSSWKDIADGEVDDRIDRLADHIRTTFPERFFLTVWHEPENDVDPLAGSGMTAGDYASMFRHVVQRLRQGGVDNAVTVMTYMGNPQWGVAPWFPELYPGDDVVQWIGMDPYIKAVPTPRYEGGLPDIVDRTGQGWPGFYTWAQQHYPSKPIMVAEWGVFSDERLAWRKAWVYRSVAAQIDRYPAIKGLVYFDSPQAPRGDTRIDSDPDALQAYRELGASPELVAPAAGG